MGTTGNALFERFSPVGDLTVIAVCIVMSVLMLFSYISRGRSLRIFLSIISLLVVAALSDVSWNTLIRLDNPSNYTVAYILRLLYHAALFAVFFLYALYIAEVTGLEDRMRRIATVSAGALLLGAVLADVIVSLGPSGFRVLEDGTVQRGFNVFLVGYILFSMMMVYLLYRVRNYLYRRVMYGFYGSVTVSYVIMITQQVFGYSSFTVATFLFPVVAMFYIMHSSPYNVALGSVDIQAMHDMVRTLHTRKIPFGFISLYMPALDAEGSAIPENMQAVIRRFAADYFRGAYLFQIHNGHILLLFLKRRNPDYEHRIENILGVFKWEHRYFQYDYKIVIGESVDAISERNEYAAMIQGIHRKMKDNTVYRMEPDDIEAFRQDMYILEELADIHRKKDPDDPRVLAYCQPVLNLETGRFDTAEALMRLRLDQIGLVLPDQFIHLAEEHGYVHTLTEIILHKTCEAIRLLTKDGYAVGRISVNISALELKDEAFCGDINRVIRASGIPGERIAIELTESRSEEDFMLVKDKILELRGHGIKLYLDDFGTGYTNLERIVELPFDIIKFDRSMVTASGLEPRAVRLLENLAASFAGMGYSILFEGVESESDESRCKGMSASYLQGYKYSRPVPIEQLSSFFPRSEDTPAPCRNSGQ